MMVVSALYIPTVLIGLPRFRSFSPLHFIIIIISPLIISTVLD